jgi:hypothetical protein
MKWYIQTNFGKDSRIEEFIFALKKNQSNYETFEYIPHSNKLPTLSVDSNEHAFLYGSTSVITLASQTKKWKNHLFFNDEHFNYQSWAKHYGSLLLNDPKESSLMMMKDFEKWIKDKDPEEFIFVRPNKDLKEFNGSVVLVKDFFKWCKNVCEKEYPTVNANTEIIVGKPHGIKAEYRCFMTSKGDVVAYSQYTQNGKIKMDVNIPKEVLAKAKQVTKVWSPAKLFTLDIALSGEDYWIVEAQSIHSSGFYSANLDDYIKNIETFYQKDLILEKDTIKTMKL